MNKAFATIAIFTIFILLFSGCVQPEQPEGADDSVGLNTNEIPENGSSVPESSLDKNTDLSGVEISLSVSTDKEEYGSQEEVVITVVANASESVKGVTVKVWGITPYSKNYIENEKTVDLEEGENSIEFVEITPYCTAGCGGVYPGPYNLLTSIEWNGKELTRGETTITLASH